MPVTIGVPDPESDIVFVRVIDCAVDCDTVLDAESVVIGLDVAEAVVDTLDDPDPLHDASTVRDSLGVLVAECSTVCERVLVRLRLGVREPLDDRVQELVALSD